MKKHESLHQSLKLLIVSPHPDDAELGMGGTMIKVKNEGHRIKLVDLTSGEPTPYGNEQKREKEAWQAKAVLGVEQRINLGLRNRYLFDSKEARLSLAEEIRLWQPEIVFAPYPDDAHPDHLAAAKISAAARFYAKFSKVKLKGARWYTPVFLSYMCTHLRIAPQITFLVDTSPFFDQKIKAMECYKSQFIENAPNRFIFEYIEARDRYWGSLIGAGYAEAFYAKEVIKLADLSQLL